MPSRAFPLDRRSFLRLASAAVAAALGAGLAPALAQAHRRRRVLVLGGGLAGLAAAWELRKRGHEVLVLEARRRFGGRVHSVRSAAGGRRFEAGQYAEAGAHRIPDVHDHTLGYVSELRRRGHRLALRKYSSALPGGGEGRTLHLLRGQRFFDPGDGSLGQYLELGPEEAAEGLARAAHYEWMWVSGSTNTIGDPRAADWPADPAGGDPARIAEYDQLTLAEFLASQGASPDWLRLYASENGTEIFRLNALSWLAQTGLDLDWTDTYAIEGGNDRLPRALAAELRRCGAVLVQGAQVQELEQRAGGVRVVYVDAHGRERSARAEHVVCTLPFPVLRRLRVHPAFPDDKRTAIDALELMPVGRVSLQTRSRFWHAEGIGGLKLVRTDTELERIWDSSNTQPGAAGMIHSYVQHENALALGRIPRAQRVRHVRERMTELVFPELAGEHLGLGYAKLWQEDPLAGGGWAAPRPGGFAERLALWRRPEGRIHFAGEHTSVWSGWMQGAIESGKRAAREIEASDD